MKTRVLVVDDSAIARTVFTRELDKDPGIEVIGGAPDAFVARDKIVTLAPDVITLDLEMPRLDGLSFLKKLMAHHPLPVVIVSSFTPSGCDLSLQALEAGAVDVLEKPGSAPDDLALFGALLRERVLAAAKVSLHAPPQARAARPAAPIMPFRRVSERIIVMGASTGGTEALRSILETLPAECPPIAIVQHMPERFTRPFAERLNSHSALEVLEAEDGMALQPGRAIVARGGFHMLLQRVGQGYAVRVKEGPLVRRHKPSVEVLFESAARTAGAAAVGVLLTGMGDDGAQGLKMMRDAGARTIAQDEASCVVFGMPREAILLGAAERVVSLDKIPAALFSSVQHD